MPRTLDSGIEVGGGLPGYVPEYECREACVYAVATWYDWLHVMDGLDRAAAVAHYRVHLMIDAHINDAAEQRRARDAARRRS